MLSNCVFLYNFGSSPIITVVIFAGENTNAVPHYHKSCSWVSHIWGEFRDQYIWRAAGEPRPALGSRSWCLPGHVNIWKQSFFFFLSWNSVTWSQSCSVAIKQLPARSASCRIPVHILTTMFPTRQQGCPSVLVLAHDTPGFWFLQAQPWPS